MIFFDIGAWDGQDMFHLTNDTNNIVYAFEPSPPQLQNFLYPLASQRSNYKVIPKAVHKYNGTIKFNITAVDGDGVYRGGCNSIYEFNEDLSTWDVENKTKKWPIDRTDFKHVSDVEVECITIEKFIEENNIDRVEWMHCDAQGNDLNVLKSFGKYIDRLNGGRIEVFLNSPLYNNYENMMGDAINFLNANNFTITEIVPNAPVPNEFNLIFWNNNKLSN